MRLLWATTVAFLSSLPLAFSASAWTFDDATLTIQGKGSEVAGGVKEKLSPTAPLTSSALMLSSTDSLKIVLTTLEGKTARRPHQAFLTLAEQTTGLEESFAFSVKGNGKAKVDLLHKDLPHQLATSPKPLRASIVLGSFGSTTPFKQHVFNLAVEAGNGAAPNAPTPAERYSAKPEIHHIFRDDPKSPPMIISLLFTLAVLGAIPLLAGGWLFLGGNLDHFGKAFGANPVAHGLFLGSVIAMEGIFFMYYTSWNLFQTLPAAAIVGAVAYVSGSRALTEVQERRLSGQR